MYNKKFYIVPHSLDGRSYKILKEALGATGIKPYDSNYVHRDGNLVVNWGLYGTHRGYEPIMNPWKAVGVACSKMRSFFAFASLDVRHPAWTRSYTKAKEWLQTSTIYERHCDDGCMGEGIVVKHMGDHLDSARFYTKKFPTEIEYRVYVAYGQVIDIREKAEPDGMSLDPDVQANDDWLYLRRNNGDVHPQLLSESLAACKAVGLDFCGVDIAIDKDDNTAVFEVNSAPWLGFRTANALTKILKEKFL